MGRYIYREDNVKIARSARIGNGVVLGSGTVVEENAFVVHSVLGPNCIIGAGAVVEESHLWEGKIVLPYFTHPYTTIKYVHVNVAFNLSM